jgi:hypothetical protein
MREARPSVRIIPEKAVGLSWVPPIAITMRVSTGGMAMSMENTIPAAATQGIALRALKASINITTQPVSRRIMIGSTCQKFSAVVTVEKFS